MGSTAAATVAAQERQAGYALIVILLFVTLVLISLSTAVPSILTQGQREKEQELIFRGEQYKQAIGRYYRKFGRYPTKIEELLETNKLAFLRREYLDPMTKDGKWRVIRIGPTGELIGSSHEREPLGRPVGATGQGTGPGSTGTGPAGNPGTGTTGSTGGSSSGTGGVEYPIAGVASQSTENSIRVYEGYSRYNEWEFIYDPVKEALESQPPVQGGTPLGTGSSSGSSE
jgi:type II secretory pathway pseudopilin PulG